MPIRAAAARKARDDRARASLIAGSSPCFGGFGRSGADPDPTLLAGSWRTFGNGGFFSMSGWFYSKTLGRYRAFVTDRRDAVILKFVDRTIVVSPNPAQEFAETVLSSAR